MSVETIQRLLKFIYQDRDHLDQWLENPHSKCKEWSFDLNPQTIDAVSATLQYIFHELQQIQEVRNVNQRSVMKLDDASRHHRWSFYATLAMHMLVFGIGMLMLVLGIYAAFADKAVLGFLLGIAGGAEIVYFLLVRPWQGLNENIGNMVQMEVALGGWFNEMAYWQVFLRDTRLEEKQSVAQAMRDATKWTIMLIDDYCSVKHINHNKSDDEDFISKTRSLIESLTARKKQRDSEARPTAVVPEPIASPKPPEATKPALDSDKNAATPANKSETASAQATPAKPTA